MFRMLQLEIVCLDVKDLVVKTVGGEQRPEKKCSSVPDLKTKSNFCKNPSLAADLCEQEKKKDEDRVETSQKKQKLQGSKKRACFSFQDQGGLSEIKAKLFQYRERLSGLRAGQTKVFGGCLRVSNYTSLFREEYVEAKKESSQKQAECALSPDKLKTMLNKMRPSERLDAPLLEDELIPALPSEFKSEHEEEIIDQRLVY
ncbi:unnamed protein product [Porites lobata]|uniref:Uncharacterized protein n=1 Tax=Porites lobata TaxID=104759 RepID=A0ABN8RHS7_9CNID|nr:unnamed protein product [Porites lobata]